MTTRIVSSVAEVLTELSTLSDGAAPLIVAIDGRAGAGKSSLARKLISAIPGAAHIEFDWFHLPKNQVTPESGFDHTRLLTEVIQPFLQGTKSFRVLRYNWGFLAGIEDGFHAEPVVISSATALVIEGCETLHQQLSPYYTLRIWVDTSAEESKRRGIKRDIEEYKLDPDKVNVCWEEWIAREEKQILREERRCRADLILA